MRLPCPRCHTVHHVSVYCRPQPNCGARLDDPFAGRHAECILAPGHRSPGHWGPDQHGVYSQWPS